MGGLLALVISLAGVPGEDTVAPDRIVLRDSAASAAPDNERLSETDEGELDHSGVLDRLLWLQENPMNLNAAREEDLLLVPGVTTEEAQTIVRLRDRIGKFSSIGQLEVVEGVGPGVAARLQPYFHVPLPSSGRVAAGPPLLSIRTRVMRDLQQRRGFSAGAYAGSGVKSYSRVAMNVEDHFRSGMLLVKDAGEQFPVGLLSGFVEARIGESRILAGDFSMEAGQGLVFWSGASYGKGSDAVGVARKSGGGPRPYRSSSESGFFRGAAATTTLEVSGLNLRLAALVSRRNLSATLNEDATFSTFYDAGLFRTESELSKRNTVRETIAGGHAGVSGKGVWNAGISYYHSTFGRTLTASSPLLFSGRVNDVAGVDGSFRAGRLEMFGELAHSGRRGNAGILGGTLSVGRGTRLVMVYRNYGPSFDHIHAGAFGERGNVNNESGFYLGVRSVLSRSVTFNGYVDHFRFGSPTSTLPLPATGTDLLVESDVSVSASLSLTGRYSLSVSQSRETFADPAGRDARVVVDRSGHRARLTATYDVSPAIRLRGRMEGTLVRYPLLHREESGYLLFQELRYGIPENLTLEFRLVFFETASFDTRLYAYENDLQGVFSNPALHGRGRRWYALARYRLTDALRFSLKYAETQKDGVTSIGTGAAEVMGDLDNRLSVQLDCFW